MIEIERVKKRGKVGKKLENARLGRDRVDKISYIYIFNVITTCIKMYYTFREEKDEIYKFEKIERAFDEI